MNHGWQACASGEGVAGKSAALTPSSMLCAKLDLLGRQGREAPGVDWADRWLWWPRNIASMPCEANMHVFPCFALSAGQRQSFCSLKYT